MDTNGWIKLYRKMQDWQWYQDSQMVHLMLHLTMTACTKTMQWKDVEVGRGQLFTSRKKLSVLTGISEQSVRTCLKRLEKSSSIAIKSTNGGMLITVCNFESYQVAEDEGNQPINQPTNQQLTNDQPTTNQPVTRIKEYKKDNNKLLSKEQQQQQQQTCEAEMIRRLKLPEVMPENQRKVTVEQLMNAWNYYVEAYKKKGCKVAVKPMIRLTPKRRELMQYIVERYTAEDIMKVLMNVMTSDYCNGRKKDREGKPAQPEWVFGDEDRFQRLMEGGYN